MCFLILRSMKNRLIVDVIDPEGILNRPTEPFNDRALGSPFTDRVFRAVEEPSGEAVATIIILNGNHRAGISLETNAALIQRVRTAGPVIFVSLNMGKSIGSLRAPETSERGEVWVQMLIPFGIPQPKIHFQNPVNAWPLSRLGDALRRYTQVERFSGPTPTGPEEEEEEEEPSRGGVSSGFGSRQRLPHSARMNVGEMQLQVRLETLELVMGNRVAALERRVAELEAGLRVAHTQPAVPGAGPEFRPRGMTREVYEVDVQNVNGQFFTIGRSNTPLVNLAGRLPQIVRQQLQTDQAVLMFYRSGARVSASSKEISAAAGQLMRTYGFRHIALVVLATSDPAQDNIQADDVDGVFTLRTSDDYVTVDMTGRHAKANVLTLRALVSWMKKGRMSR